MILTLSQSLHCHWCILWNFRAQKMVRFQCRALFSPFRKLMWMHMRATALCNRTTFWRQIMFLLLELWFGNIIWMSEDPPILAENFGTIWGEAQSVAWLCSTEQSRKGLRESLFPQKPATHLLKAQSLANWWALIPAMCCSQWLSSVPEVK